MVDKIKNIGKTYGIFIGFLFTYLLTGMIGLKIGLNSYLITSIANLVGITLALLGHKFLVEDKDTLSALDGARWAEIGIFSAISIFANISLSIWLQRQFANSITVAREGAINNTSMVIAFLFSIVFAPVAEELMMRFFAYNLLKRSSHWIAAMLVTSIVFGAMHGTVEHLVSGTLFGITAVILYELSDTIIVPIVFHILYNFVIMCTTSNMYMSEGPALVVIMLPYIFLMGFLIRKIIKKNIGN